MGASAGTQSSGRGIGDSEARRWAPGERVGELRGGGNSSELAYVCVLSHFTFVQLFSTPWTVARQAPLSMGLSRQE